jgi:hypothetical protein
LPEFSLGIPTLLAATATLLLIFVSGGVIYLSTIEWRDRRRRQAAPLSRR